MYTYSVSGYDVNNKVILPLLINFNYEVIIFIYLNLTFESISADMNEFSFYRLLTLFLILLFSLFKNNLSCFSCYQETSHFTRFSTFRYAFLFELILSSMKNTYQRFFEKNPEDAILDHYREKCI